MTESQNPAPSGSPQPPAQKSSHMGLLIAAVLVVLVVPAVAWSIHRHNAATSAAASRNSTQAPTPVVLGKVVRKDVPIYLDGLGTVQAFNTVTVRARVDGQVMKVAFVEGQDVRAGDLLAQIDPAPFQAQLDESIAKKAQDQAQLSIAQLTLDRDKELLA